MQIRQLQDLAKSTDTYVSETFEFILKNAVRKCLGDSGEFQLTLPSSSIEELSQIAYSHVQARHISAGITFDSLQDAKDKTQIKILGDTLFNNKTGVGTLIDPTTYTHSTIPVMFGPYEGTSLYSSGGLPAQIIDKKARAMVLQGATFKSLQDDFWDNNKIKMLEDAATETGFNDTINDASANSFIYGGSICYPVYSDDNVTSFEQDMYTRGLKQGCVSRWVNVDRWNVTMVPSFIVTAKDYLRPKTIYLPQSALVLDTSRVAMIKPKPMPYWANLYNLGWAPSDMSGWIRSYYGYEITCQSIPIMAQQMSLILYRMPLDALNATIGHDKVEKLMKINEQKMAEWNVLSPQAVNMVGEVEVVDRTYTGIEQLTGIMKSNLASQCGIPEPTLWHTPNKGFSDNTTESLLKQSETLLMSQSFLERNMTPCTDALIAHVFGTDSKEWEYRHKIKMTFNKPIISTEKDMAEAGARFAASVSSFAQSGISPDLALKLSSQFFPTVKITEDMIREAKNSYEEYLKRGGEQQLGQGQGHVVGVNKNTGKATK